MREPTTDRAASTQPRVAWLSPAFGFGDDLVYFNKLFAGFLKRFPNGFVPISTDFPLQRYPDLPLAPIMKWMDIRLPHRNAGASSYENWLRLPTPASLIRFIRLWPKVIVVTEFSHVSLGGWLVGKATGKPVVVLVESDPSFRGAPTSTLVTTIKSWIARHSDAVLVSNQIGATYLTEQLNLPANKLVIGPYLTSMPDVDFAAEIDRDGPVRLLFLNSVTQRKGVPEMLRALARTPVELRGSWHLDLVGTGDLDQTVDQLIDELDLGANVTRHGRVAYADTGAYYQRAEVVLCPTLADYRSLSGFEAVNAGRILIASVHDGASEELSRLGGAVIVVDPLDEAAFAESITCCLSRSARFQELAEAALTVPEEFSAEAACNNFAEAVHHALNARSGRH
jgi:glycosyltransferase involved in cell wall biosynthesis